MFCAFTWAPRYRTSAFHFRRHVKSNHEEEVKNWEKTVNLSSIGPEDVEAKKREVDRNKPAKLGKYTAVAVRRRDRNTVSEEINISTNRNKRKNVSKKAGIKAENGKSPRLETDEKSPDIHVFQEQKLISIPEIPFLENKIVEQTNQNNKFEKPADSREPNSSDLEKIQLLTAFNYAISGTDLKIIVKEENYMLNKLKYSEPLTMEKLKLELSNVHKKGTSIINRKLNSTKYSTLLIDSVILGNYSLHYFYLVTLGDNNQNPDSNIIPFSVKVINRGDSSAFRSSVEEVCKQIDDLSCKLVQIQLGFTKCEKLVNSEITWIEIELPSGYVQNLEVISKKEKCVLLFDHGNVFRNCLEAGFVAGGIVNDKDEIVLTSFIQIMQEGIKQYFSSQIGQEQILFIIFALKQQAKEIRKNQNQPNDRIEKFLAACFSQLSCYYPFIDKDDIGNNDVASLTVKFSDEITALYFVSAYYSKDKIYFPPELASFESKDSKTLDTYVRTLKVYLNRCLIKQADDCDAHVNDVDCIQDDYGDQKSSGLSILHQRILAARTFKRDNWLDENLKYFKCHESGEVQNILSLSKQFSCIGSLQMLFVVGYFKNKLNSMLGH